MAYEPSLLCHMNRFYWGWGWSLICWAFEPRLKGLGLVSSWMSCEETRRNATECHWAATQLFVLAYAHCRTIDAKAPSQIQKYQETPRLHENVRKIRTDFCLLCYNISQEPSENCSENKCSDEFSLVWVFSFAFSSLKAMSCFTNLQRCLAAHCVLIVE